MPQAQPPLLLAQRHYNHQLSADRYLDVTLPWATAWRGPLHEARRRERRLAELVNAAYGLTPEEVELLWRTVPPRMPAI